VAPQSYQQEWMAAGKLHHPNPGWNLHLFWRFTGRLDHRALLAALGEVVARHEVLRTTHAVRDGEAVQVVHRPRRPEVDVSDLRRQSDALRATELDRRGRPRPDRLQRPAADRDDRGRARGRHRRPARGGRGRPQGAAAAARQPPAADVLTGGAVRSPRRRGRVA
jgi:hypothetical protein